MQSTCSRTFTGAHEFHIKQISTILRWKAFEKPSKNGSSIEFKDLPFWVPARHKPVTNSAQTRSSRTETLWRISVTYIYNEDEKDLKVTLTALPTAAENRKSGWLRFAVDYFIDVYTVPSGVNSSMVGPAEPVVSCEGFQKVFTSMFPHVGQTFPLQTVLPPPSNAKTKAPELDLIIRARIGFTTNDISLPPTLTSPDLSLPRRMSLTEPTFDLTQLLGTDNAADITFTFDADTRTIKAHRVILSSRNTYFATLLSLRWLHSGNSDPNTVHITENTYEAFLAAVYYLYSAKLITPDIPLTIFQLQDIYAIADMYDIPGLQFVTKEALQSPSLDLELDHDTWYDHLAFAFRYDVNELAGNVRGFVVERWEELVGSREMQRLVKSLVGPRATERDVKSWSTVVKAWLMLTFEELAKRDRIKGLQYKL
ncbi:hypothetical protein BC936DRAFT_143033 [Jimgerdemannia flammicorona]|uniref:BTB domain-containing protein n=1 Tax=Jimgerdemannia flammicorona TaxID=994334 RepID=A0A432ZZX5_9FUNG|nr:hypothetical protein BC936DRAFT_143033 [Jimgerdemannia flammicorona]